MEQPKFILLGELKKLYVKIPLLHSFHDLPIYAKTVKGLCVRKLGRNTKDPPIVHEIRKNSKLIMG